jgi:hypothetical protein
MIYLVIIFKKISFPKILILSLVSKNIVVNFAFLKDKDSSLKNSTKNAFF